MFTIFFFAMAACMDAVVSTLGEDGFLELAIMAEEAPVSIVIQRIMPVMTTAEWMNEVDSDFDYLDAESVRREMEAEQLYREEMAEAAFDAYCQSVDH